MPELSRVLVTGGKGFIGSRLAAALREGGAQVTTLSRGRGGGDHLRIDLADASRLRRAIVSMKPDTIFHLAGSRARGADLRALRENLETNVLGTMNLLEAAASLRRPPRFVTLGTIEEYGPDCPAPRSEDRRESPANPYAFSRLCASRLSEIFHRLNAIPSVALRASVIYGPGQPKDMFLSALITSLRAGRPFRMTSGRQARDFLHVDDAVSALIRAARSPRAAGRVINVTEGHPRPVADVARLVARLMGRRGLLRLGALPTRPGETMDYGAPNALARRLLGWRPRVRLEDGLKLTIAGGAP